MANNASQVTRRRFAAGLALGSVALALPFPAFALTLDQAKALIEKAIAEVNTTINSGKSESAMLGDFQRIFSRYADGPKIAQTVMGVSRKTASAGQIKAFTKAYTGYFTRKYGRRFREFIGGTIEVTGGRQIKSFFEVVSVANLTGEAPFDLRWHVSDGSGKNLFFNIIIEGVNMLSTERSEIGALLDQRKGDLDRLIADLNTL